jgi:hypothetical protein
MLTTNDIIIGVFIAFVLRDVLTTVLDYTADIIERRRVNKALEEYFDELDRVETQKKHPAGRKRTVKKK